MTAIENPSTSAGPTSQPAVGVRFYTLAGRTQSSQAPPRADDRPAAGTSIGPVKLTTKGPIEKQYQTPYGVATVARHVYQAPQGGPTYCPLDRDARIVVSSTPRFAKTLSHKYAEFSSTRAQIDLAENHGRVVPAA